jgi:hypothetical protein
MARRCSPLFGRFVCPKRKWFYHVNVLVTQHYVDALTGADGLEQEEYIAQHWADTAAFAWEDLADDVLEDLAGWTSQTS